MTMTTIVSVCDELSVMLDLMALLLLYQQEEATSDLWKVDRVHVQRGPQGLRSIQEDWRRRLKKAETGEGCSD